MSTRRKGHKPSSGGVRPRAIPRPPRKAREAREPSNRPLPFAEASARIALLAAQAGLEKKAAAVEIIDVMGKVDYADFLVLMSGSSDRHVGAIADAVDELLGKNGIQSISIEGRPQGSWVLIDFVDVVVHVFQKEARAVYDLDGLWMDAQRLPIPGSSPEHS